MNRAQRRELARNPDRLVCVYGHVMKTDGHGRPLCPYRCGFIRPIPVARRSARAQALVDARRRSAWLDGLPGPPWVRSLSLDDLTNMVREV